ncbi:MAG: hypothetical protein ACXAEF_09995 [Candidatus Thorarchaeota archaeon]
MVDAYQLKICSEKTGYEVKPRGRIKLDIMALKDRIVETSRMRAKVSIPALLLLEDDNGGIINIFPSGRLLLRNFSTQEDAEELVARLAPLLYSED